MYGSEIAVRDGDIAGTEVHISSIAQQLQSDIQELRDVLIVQELRRGVDDLRETMVVEGLRQGVEELREVVREADRQEEERVIEQRKVDNQKKLDAEIEHDVAVYKAEQARITREKEEFDKEVQRSYNASLQTASSTGNDAWSSEQMWIIDKEADDEPQPRISAPTPDPTTTATVDKSNSFGTILRHRTYYDEQNQRLYLISNNREVRKTVSKRSESSRAVKEDHARDIFRPSFTLVSLLAYASNMSRCYEDKSLPIGCVRFDSLNKNAGRYLKDRKVIGKKEVDNCEITEGDLLRNRLSTVINTNPGADLSICPNHRYAFGFGWKAPLHCLHDGCATSNKPKRSSLRAATMEQCGTPGPFPYGGQLCTDHRKCLSRPPELPFLNAPLSPLSTRASVDSVTSDISTATVEREIQNQQSINTLFETIRVSPLKSQVSAPLKGQ
ncbi:unnamed protein product, partial [Didymodactylos carnosus]